MGMYMYVYIYTIDSYIYIYIYIIYTRLINRIFRYLKLQSIHVEIPISGSSSPRLFGDEEDTDLLGHRGRGAPTKGGRRSSGVLYEQRGEVSREKTWEKTWEILKNLGKS